MDPVRARQGKLIAGIGGLALFGFLFLPWFGEPGGSLTGWEGQTTTDIYLLITAKRVGSGFYDKKGTYETVEVAGLYWHFVDLVWVFIFAFFYLW